MKAPKYAALLSCSFGSSQSQPEGVLENRAWQCHYNKSLVSSSLLAPIFTIWQVGCTFGLSFSFEFYLNFLCSGFQIALGDICLSPVKPKG